MKKYYLHNGKEQQGPYSLEELKTMSISSKTMIWFDGISGWTEAQFIPEIKDIIINTPPPFEKIKATNPVFNTAKTILDKDLAKDLEQKIPKERNKKIFKWSLVILAVLGTVFLITKLYNFGNNAINNNSKIVGEWEIKSDYGEKESVIFKDDGTFISIKNNKVQDFIMKDVILKYETRESKNPHQIDILIIDKEDKDVVMRIKGIYEFINDKTMRFFMNADSYNPEKLFIRPKSFSEGSSEKVWEKLN